MKDIFSNGDVDATLFLSQAKTLRALNLQPRSLHDLIVKFQKLAPEARLLLSELEKAIRIILTIPVTSATAERSFSAVRRIKTWLRSSMTQERFNNLMVLHIHQPEVDLEHIVKIFIGDCPKREKMCGKKIIKE